MRQIVSSIEDLYAPVRDDLGRVRAVFDSRLDSDFPFVRSLCDHVRGYRGKMLRPALLLLTARATGDLTEQHVTLAAVVEMIHLAALVHDDVLDQADTRRKARTINAMNGNESAVLLGDFLISHAYHLCSTLDSQYASCRIGQTARTVCEGELMQIHHRGNYRLIEPDYLEIIRRKTAALTAVCCELGARFAGATERTVDAMATFGLNVGIAFQIVDDVLDLVGSESRMGKTLGRDLELGKPTLPVIHCLQHAEAHVAAELVSILSNGWARQRRQVCEWLSGTGSITYAMDKAGECVRLASDPLACLVPSAAKDSLERLTRFILTREQ